MSRFVGQIGTRGDILKEEGGTFTGELIVPTTNSASTEMVLMIAPKPPREILEKERIKDLIQRLYLEIYEKESNDSVLISLLDKIPEQIKLTNTPLL